MPLASDLKILAAMVFGKTKGGGHADRLESFYEGQASGYDDFRKRLLHGREEMMRGLELPTGGRLIDMGGGTGHNLESIADRLPALASVEIVDLSPSLLNIAKQRINARVWQNVTTVHADVTNYEPAYGLVDAVTFSYSLTMIPEWFRAMDHACKLLKPGGMIGVVDFYVARKWPGHGSKKHSGFQRTFWPNWFGYDNVFLSPDHLPYLQYRFEPVKVVEGLGKVPYLGMKAPYYIFLGRKKRD